MIDPGTRCGHTVKAYELSRYPEVAVPDQYTRCGRRAGHPGHKHLSRAAYERELERKRQTARERRAGRARPVRDLEPCGSEAAYRRHLRRGEVPCEACRIAANEASDGYRKARTDLAA